MQRYHQEDFENKTEHRSLGGLLTDLTNQLTTLVRQEFELARVEMTHKATAMVKDAVMMGAGGALLYAGLLVFLAAVAIGLSAWMPLWLSTLIVSVVVLGTGAILFTSGKKRMKTRDLKPTQTIISLKENKKWIKQQT